MIEVTIKGKKRVFDSEKDHELFKEISKKLQKHVGDDRRKPDYNLDDYIDEKVRQIVEEIHKEFCDMQLESKHVVFFGKEFNKAF